MNKLDDSVLEQIYKYKWYDDIKKVNEYFLNDFDLKRRISKKLSECRRSCIFVDDIKYIENMLEDTDGNIIPKVTMLFYRDMSKGSYSYFMI